MVKASSGPEMVRVLLGEGLTIDAAADRADLPLEVVRGWVLDGLELLAETYGESHVSGAFCPCVRDVPEEPYAYLLGLYLGDGTLARRRNEVYKLRIFQDNKYPWLIRQCTIAMQWVIRNKVRVIQQPGCKEIYSLSKHWPCLLPQHGPGRKHERPIILEPWQRLVAIERHPQLLLRGLIHSDGCRYIKRVESKGKEYVYTRYQFTNRSADIRRIFTDACDRVGIDWREYPYNVVICRRSSIEKLDQFIGPKS